jgi:probable rRNA maturation factor
VSLNIEVLIDANVTSSVDGDEFARAAEAAARSRGFDRGEIGIRVTDDPTIREVNQRHLQHDYPTDVISFGYLAEPPTVEGELIISVDTARRRAIELGWKVSNELLLYAVHGVLHLTGMDDGQPERRREMRLAEQAIMAELGISELERFGADVRRSDQGSSDHAFPDKPPRTAVTEQKS